MGMEDAPPATHAEVILRSCAPELAGPVHAFLHGGGGGRLRPCDTPAEALRKLSELTTYLQRAHFGKKPAADVAVLAAAVRLQAMIVYECLKALHGADAAAG